MSNSPIRLLAVDDVAMNLTMLSELLGAAGFIVDTASTAGAGFTLACQNRYALLLFDIQLPDFNGDVLLQRLRANSAANSNASPAFALTGELSAALGARLKQSGFAQVFAKPWSAEAIISAVQQATGASAVVPVALANSELGAALFDRSQALKTTGGDEKLMLKLRAMLVTELKNKGAALRIAFEQSDTPNLNEQRHKLAGAAGFTGATQLATALERLKAQPSDASLASVEAAMAAIIAASN